MPLEVARAAPLARVRKAIPKLGDQRRHLSVVGFVLWGVGTDAGLDRLHYRSFESFGSCGLFGTFAPID
jgi:hypothetical protein